ncbi:hypothetical protein HPP92_009636 [Vanilla planifolia]|uniref:Uncharacterized protein n=1 Tax=Vanilla planifolia TaxID=51239 RepID=A0A835V4X7_VANPL|nr:hypothetical protein HPP92_009636 [Vanilla planifolia]
MATSPINENFVQSKAVKCGDGDKNFWSSRSSENADSQSNSCTNCEILKSGPLYISSKGIGWTSWKKRWFVLSCTSLMFYRADPNALPQKGSEVSNPILGGIELNYSGSIVVKPDKKLLTVLFPDGRDGRAFTLKTETVEELNEWKAALENALARAPSASHVMGQTGIFRSEMAESVEASVEQCKEKPPTMSSVTGRPVLLALEDSDGCPSFLEKALRFIEENGIKVEGILRQSADVEEVVRRVHQYEQGKNEFSPGEDAHVIGDCIKHVLREMPSSAVPASCCTALVDAYRADPGSRINAIRDAVYDVFPEPNRRLLQRVLQMMLTVAAHKVENRMSPSALAACMAPLLLRPLLAGECELKSEFQMDGDGSFQLLQAAAAANHAQAIVIIFLEEYDKIFDDGPLPDESFSSELYTESEDDEDIEDGDLTASDVLEDDGDLDAENNLKNVATGDPDCSNGGTIKIGGDIISEDGSDLGIDVGSDISSGVDSEICNDCAMILGVMLIVLLVVMLVIKSHRTNSISSRNTEAVSKSMKNSKTLSTSVNEDIAFKRPVSINIKSPVRNLSFVVDVQKDDALLDENAASSVPLSHTLLESMEHVISKAANSQRDNILHSSPEITRFPETLDEKQPAIRNKWGRTSARKNLSMDSIEYTSDDESAIQRLESTKIHLQTKVSREIEENATLRSTLDRRKEALHERRLALEKEVLRLQDQLQEERNLRSLLESGLMSNQPTHFCSSAYLDNKTRFDLEDIALIERDIVDLKKNVADLTDRLEKGSATFCESCGQPIYTRNMGQKNVDNIARAKKGDFSQKHDNTKQPPRAAALPSLDNQHSTSKKKQPTGSEESNDANMRPENENEEVNSSSSALAKLTNRLNFLKERRVQLANELQNLDLARTTSN